MNLTGLRYEGPIYRPPSESNSLLVQATIGCPHNKCTFCMVYKNGPKFRIRAAKDIKEDLFWAKKHYGGTVRTVFFPSGNTIVMKTKDMVEIFDYTNKLFPNLERITVYGSSQYIVKKGLDDMKKISRAGLSRIHVGLESGDDVVLERVKKGSNSKIQIQAGSIIKNADIELSEYVVLGLGGKDRTKQHIKNTLRVLNKIDPDFIRIRTFLPKVNTPILEDIKNNFFQITPHDLICFIKPAARGLKLLTKISSHADLL